MASYKSDIFSGITNVPQPYDASHIYVGIPITLPTSLVVGDLLELIRLPAGVFITDFAVKAAQLDSNAAPTLAFSLGVENAAFTDLDTVLEAGVIPGRGAKGSVHRMVNGDLTLVDKALADALAFSNPANPEGVRRIALKVTTAAATAAFAGKVLIVDLALRG